MDSRFKTISCGDNAIRNCTIHLVCETIVYAYNLDIRYRINYLYPLTIDFHTFNAFSNGI